MKVILAIIVVFIVMSGNCFAHQDRIITVKNDGSLEGLPLDYSPATLRIEFAAQNEGGAPITSVTFNLGKNQVRLPLCITGLLQSRRITEVKASASWYHDEKILPYYLKINFFDPGYNQSRWANAGFSLLINLRTSKLMQMEVIIVRDDGKSIQNIPIDVAAQCNSEELGGFASDAR